MHVHFSKPGIAANLQSGLGTHPFRPQGSSFSSERVQCFDCPSINLQEMQEKASPRMDIAGDSHEGPLNNQVKLNS
jgi:hypothetical protein